jgi:hypothetical protein
LTREHTLAQHSRETGLNYWQLWRHVRSFHVPMRHDLAITV